MNTNEIFQTGCWIYADCTESDDQYTEYVASINKPTDEATLYLSCDTDYTVFINGSYVASNQYGDFEHYKIYDTINVTPFLREPVNEMKILLYYCGVNTQRYRRAQAGLIYEITENGKTIASSGKNTLSRLSPTYISGRKVFVSTQLGFTFAYDSTKENEDGYRKSKIVEKTVKFFPRPIEKQKVLSPKIMQSVKMIAENTYLIDLGEETVGFCKLHLYSNTTQKLKIAYGESLDNGRVREKIHNRNFSVEYIAKVGENDFCDYMLRLSARYLEVTAEESIDIKYIGIVPQVYETKTVEKTIDNKLDRDIYDICVNTLKLCMMEHYVDTPWREQCLYAFDSRNQMLCGYLAFENGNRDYARANLKLIGEDKRDDGLLSICYPCGTELAIPSFSLYYILAMNEYVKYTGDGTLANEYREKMESVLDEFLRNTRNGLVAKFSGNEMWNFYDWSEHLEGSLHRSEAPECDLVINCLFVMALDSFAEMCGNDKYKNIADEIRHRITEAFADESGMLTLHIGKREYTTLGNSLAVLCGAVGGEHAKAVCDHIVSGNTTPSSLSMNVWKYDALMKTDEKKYREYILTEIRNSYKIMLDNGSTTVWETLDGSKAFGNAGSLCHGWSAVPIYVYHRLGIAR